MPGQNLPQMEKKSSFKFMLTMMGFGMVCAVALVSIYVPRALIWYFEPPMPMGVSCTSSIRWAVDRILWAQLIAVGVGGVLGLFIGSRLRRTK